MTRRPCRRDPVAPIGPLTLAGVPAGFLPWLAADLARARTDEGRRRCSSRRTKRRCGRWPTPRRYFAPELEVLTFPAWDCLPYDRSSPVAARRRPSGWRRCMRCSARRDKPQLLVTTVNAATQRTLTPFRIRQLVARLAPGERIDRDRLTALLQAIGYQPHRHGRRAGEFAVRGGLVDLFPAGEEQALRLDFFGDEIESVRRFDPADPAHHRQGRRLHPAARLRGAARRGQRQALPLALSREVRRHRDRRPALPGGVGRPAACAGMEHWLPLFEERLATLFDHLGDDDLDRPRRRRRPGARRGAVRGDRRLLREPRRAPRSSDAGQLPPARAGVALSQQRGMGAAIARAADPPRHARSTSRRATRSSTSGSSRRATSRRSGRSSANIYEAVVDHVADLRRSEPQGRARQLFRAARASG